MAPEIMHTEMLFSEVIFLGNKQKAIQIHLAYRSVLLNAVPHWLIWYLRCFIRTSLHYFELLAYTEFTLELLICN